MKKIIFVLLGFVPIFLFAQNNEAQDYSAEIDVQVWKPFIAAYESNGGPRFVDLHTDDILRVTKHGIRQGEAFKKWTLERYAEEGRTNRKIEFYFEHRIHSENVAYEVGYFQISTPIENGREKHSYGRFSVVLRKVDGIWKIAQDWDTDNINGHQVTREDLDRLMTN